MSSKHTLGFFNQNLVAESILKDAFADKLVPQDPNDEPASALLAHINAEAATNNPKLRNSKAKA